MEKIRQNELYTQTHHSFSKFKFLLIFIVFQLYLFSRLDKNVEALYQGQILSDTVPVYLMLFIRARKQPGDLADNCFQRYQSSIPGYFSLVF